MSAPAYVRATLVHGASAALLLDFMRQHHSFWSAFPSPVRQEFEATFAGLALSARDYHEDVAARKFGRLPERATRPVGSSEVPVGQVRSGWAHDEITVRQAAQLMGGITERAALNRVRAHELGRKVGGQWRVSLPAVEAHVQAVPR